MFIFKTKGVCSTEIRLDVEANKIKSVEFIGGCAGNALGIGSLVTGMEINQAINKLKGIKCGYKDTSCPDQLAKALEEFNHSYN
ncbi:TIGR03905 family TSCPD domain-containing protein [Clostridium gasigenes]|uniref:TIGR03905 family TSCPD domain-containing protein n=1 Tax=Clostridium gasigenes TaxID=94869 RepID=UPI001C0E8778|nr:TIGR03905 family TSCPD domain-containing protein [Clostridium gasigenes]MBU3131430.1 TIGR03905 family TSCPD domain-containing protein [Clostridium gasigenes]